MDPTHVLIDTRETGLQGYEILDTFSKRYGKDVEKATLGSVLFLFGTQHIDTWPEIVRDLADIIDLSGRRGHPVPDLCLPPDLIGTQVMPFFAAQQARHRQALPDDAVGRVAAQPVSA